MKPFITCQLAALLLAAPPAPARQAPAHPTATTHSTAAEQHADRMSQEVAQQLGLDAATTTKVRAAALTRFQKIDAAYKSAASVADRNQTLDASSREFQAAMQRILTPAQYAQYTHPKPAPKPEKPSKPKGQRID
ncbi:MAG: hypothetical protein ACRYFX_30655 [Janthinobacterium lividum]